MEPREDFEVDSVSVMRTVTHALEQELEALAGKPLMFVLVVTDGDEVITTGNGPPDISRTLLDCALDRLIIRMAQERGVHPLPEQESHP